MGIGVICKGLDPRIDIVLDPLRFMGRACGSEAGAATVDPSSSNYLRTKCLFDGAGVWEEVCSTHIQQASSFVSSNLKPQLDTVTSYPQTIEPEMNPWLSSCFNLLFLVINLCRFYQMIPCYHLL